LLAGPPLPAAAVPAAPPVRAQRGHGEPAGVPDGDRPPARHARRSAGAQAPASRDHARQRLPGRPAGDGQDTCGGPEHSGCGAARRPSLPPWGGGGRQGWRSRPGDRVIVPARRPGWARRGPMPPPNVRVLSVRHPETGRVTRAPTRPPATPIPPAEALWGEGADAGFRHPRPPADGWDESRAREARRSAVVAGLDRAAFQLCDQVEEWRRQDERPTWPRLPAPQVEHRI